MRRHARTLLLLLVIIIAAFFRLYHLKTVPPGLYPDEAVNAYNAAEANRSGEYRAYYPENNGREGLFINIQAFTLSVLGAMDPSYAREPWALRIPSALFGILTVLGIYLLAKELFTFRAAILASFFAATSVWHIIFSRIGFRAIMAPLLLVWALALLMMAYRTLRERELAGHGVRELKNAVVIARDPVRGARWQPFACAVFGGILFGLGFSTYIAYRMAPFLLIPFFVRFRREKEFWRILGAFLAAAFIAALPIGWYYLNHSADFLGRTSQVSVFSSATPFKDLGLNILKTAGMFFVYGDPNWRHNLAGRPELFWPVALLFAAGIAIGMRTLLKREKAGADRFAFSRLFLWLALTALPVVVSNEGLPHALRAILMFPPAMMLAGFGGVWCYDRARSCYPYRWFKPAAAVVLSLFIYEAYVTYFARWAARPEVADAFSADYTALAREVNAMPRSEPVYIIAEGGGIDAMIWNPATKSIETAGFPLSSQVLMFMTDTFTPERQYAKNIFYIPPRDAEKIPEGARVFTIH